MQCRCLRKDAFIENLRPGWAAVTRRPMAGAGGLLAMRPCPPSPVLSPHIAPPHLGDGHPMCFCCPSPYPLFRLCPWSFCTVRSPGRASVGRFPGARRSVVFPCPCTSPDASFCHLVSRSPAQSGGWQGPMSLAVAGLDSAFLTLRCGHAVCGALGPGWARARLTFVYVQPGPGITTHLHTGSCDLTLGPHACLLSPGWAHVTTPGKAAWDSAWPKLVRF